MFYNIGKNPINITAMNSIGIKEVTEDVLPPLAGSQQRVSAEVEVEDTNDAVT
jgi:hypothetical protein